MLQAFVMQTNNVYFVLKKLSQQVNNKIAKHCVCAGVYLKFQYLLIFVGAIKESILIYRIL